MVKILPAQIFPVANKIRKEQHVSMKDAYAMAKQQLLSGTTNMVTHTNIVETLTNMNLHNQLVKQMKEKNVKFTFKNHRGKLITTTGTLRMEKVPTNRKVEGRKTAKNKNSQVFYDVRHGVYRSYIKENLVSIL